MNDLRFFASGKLFLFGEYLVLRDALALTVPLKLGQELYINTIKEEGISWQCFDPNGACWLSIRFSESLNILSTTDERQATVIQQLLLLIKNRNPTLSLSGKKFEFHLQFNRQFGFGSSSTLISLLSQWSGENPYFLLENSFGGSGFDIAAATATSPLLFSIKEKHISDCQLPIEITQKLLFVYLGTKQTSAKEVSLFRDKKVVPNQVTQMNELVVSASHCKDITTWESLMIASETLLSSILATPTIKEKAFPDYPYAVKSLGAWGGDFVMATYRDLTAAKQYFQNKGNAIFFTYSEIVLNG